MNKTKIICTIGPASRDPEVLRRLMTAGMKLTLWEGFNGVDRLRSVSRGDR